MKNQIVSNQIINRNKRGTNKKGNITLNQKPLYLEQFPTSILRLGWWKHKARIKYVGAKAVTDSWYLNTCPFILIFNVGDAHAFDNEWQNEILKYKPAGQWRNVENPRVRSVGHENSGCRELKRR